MGINFRKSRLGLLSFAVGLALCGTAEATPYLVIDAKTGEVLAQQDATEPWYPASLTKLMSVYVALKAVQEKRVTFDTPFVVSARAARMPPSKMGFAPGTELTLDNLLKMLLVKSANDLAITLAEGIDGSVEDFAAEMNATAASLGMRESHFANPNGLQDPNHYSSARDLAIVAQALYRDFPEHADLWDIGALKLGNQIIPTHNGLMGRYPGIDGMKTGFTCPAGFNVVASATQGGRKIIAVVLGYPNAKARSLRAAALLDAGFHSRGTGVQVSALAPSAIHEPPNMRDAVCGRHREIVSEDDFPIQVGVPGAAANGAPGGDSPVQSYAPTAKTVSATQLLFSRTWRPVFTPISVFLGPVPGWTGPVMQARGTPQTQPATPAPVAATALVPAKPAARGKPRTVGTSAERAIAEKADAEAMHAKAKTSLNAAAAVPPAKATPHATVRHASVTSRTARRVRHAKAVTAEPESGATTPSSSGRSSSR